MPPTSTKTMITKAARKLYKHAQELTFRKDSGDWDGEMKRVRLVAEELNRLSGVVYDMSNVNGRARSDRAEMIETSEKLSESAYVIEEMCGEHAPTLEWTRDRIIQRLQMIAMVTEILRLNADPTRESRPYVRTPYPQPIPADSKLNKGPAQPDPNDKMD